MNQSRAYDMRPSRLSRLPKEFPAHKELSSSPAQSGSSVHPGLSGRVRGAQGAGGNPPTGDRVCDVPRHTQMSTTAPILLCAHMLPGML